MLAMYGSVATLHVVGFGVFFALVVPAHYKGLGIGISILAYTLGIRHAFDADHLSAIDNTTRKAISDRTGTDRPRPLAYGYFFSLGHSSVVVAIGVGIVVAERSVLSAVSSPHSGLQQLGGLAGTLVSAGFLLLIGMLNLVVLGGIVRVIRSMRRGCYDEAELERQLDGRGLFARFLGRWLRTIDREWKLYPVGVLFGLGFDTATEVALLATTALYASHHVPWYAILCLPLLFTAGMTLFDTTDGIFMNLAYGWAFFSPVRKVFYNLTMTGLSVAICFFIAAVEILALLPHEIPSLGHRGVWGVVASFDLNSAGFAIVGLFAITWAGAVAWWRYGRVEERWGARLQPPAPVDVPARAEPAPGVAVAER